MTDKLLHMKTEIFWQAVRANDARFDGAFVVGVKTTGIYCKPSCRARLPKRENTAFYKSPDAAEKSGFRACLRCRPRSTALLDPQVEKILKACEMIETDDLVGLDRLGAKVGLSPSHLQRAFKEIIGVSPKKYSEAKRMERFKAELREGSDVVAAMYDAGFGSSSRLYEKASENLGMTPAVYKKGGIGIIINYIITDCELGKMLVARTNRGICAVTFGDNEKTLIENLDKEYPQAEIAEDSKNLKGPVDAIVKYLAGKSRRLILPLDIQATAFQLQVWKFLQKIPYGKTMSYAEVAEKLGDRKKVRAVAQACAKNRVSILIPCHRVVGASGSLNGYRWGIERKKKLLEIEKLT